MHYNKHICLIMVVMLWACTGNINPVVYEEEEGNQTTHTGGTGTGGISMLADQPEFFEPFTISAFTQLYYNNLNWVASISTMTGGCVASMDNLQLTETCAGDTGHGYIHMTVPANTMGGAELITFRKKDYKYGLYEARIKPSSVPGVCDAFFWRNHSIGQEIDIEFLTREFGANSGKVHCVLHPGGYGATVNLNFNPSDGFHVYGFRYSENEMEWFVDGKSVVLFKRSDGAPVPTVGGCIYLNCWTGNPNWGGGPPTADATMVYDWVKFWPEGGTGIQDPIVFDN